MNSNVPKIYSSLNSIDTLLLRQAFDTSQQIAMIAETARTINKQYQAQVSSLFQSFDVINRRIIADLTAISIAAQRLIESNIFHELIEKVQFDRQATDAFNAAGWPIAPSMPKSLIQKVVELHQAGKTRFISQTIIGYYRRNNWEHLTETVGSWAAHPLFTNRLDIISDALDAHRQGKYTLSVPALLPQIEGILNDYIRANNLTAQLGKIQRVYEAAIGDPNIQGLTTWAIAETLLFCFQNNTYVYSNFENELKKSLTDRKVSRHTVLHGISTGYNRPIHSLKTFLLLDAITILHT